MYPGIFMQERCELYECVQDKGEQSWKSRFRDTQI